MYSADDGDVRGCILYDGAEGFLKADFCKVGRVAHPIAIGNCSELLRGGVR